MNENSKKLWKFIIISERGTCSSFQYQAEIVEAKNALEGLIREAKQLRAENEQLQKRIKAFERPSLAQTMSKAFEEKIKQNEALSRKIQKPLTADIDPNNRF